MGSAVDRATLIAFVGIVILGGINGTAIKVANHDLAPLWNATLRFGVASLMFFAFAAARGIAMPRGRRLVGSVLYGALAFGVAFALISWALVFAPVGVAQIILALVPLLTLLLAVLQRLERFRLQSLAGGLVAVSGIGLVFADRLGTSVGLVPLLAILLGAVAMAESNVIVKRFPRAHPVSNNAVAMATGAVMLLTLSLVFGERLSVPAEASTWLALGYLVMIGTVVLFTLFLFVISRWTASATSYSMLLMPLVAVVVAAVQLGEPITAAVVAGGALVLVGVYLGAFAPTLARPFPGLFRRAPRIAGETAGPLALQTPNCP
jgi:drug/metabolite transporter (DMT)-like permease